MRSTMVDMLDYTRKNELLLTDGNVIQSGDIIRIDGERKRRFLFLEYVVNNENGAQWVNTIELMKGNDGPFRSFRPERVRIIGRRRR